MGKPKHKISNWQQYNQPWYSTGRNRYWLHVFYFAVWGIDISYRRCIFLIQTNAVLVFWIVYVLTRPLGASIGDWLSQSVKSGGLGLGGTSISLFFVVIITALVIHQTRTNRQQDVVHDRIEQE